MDRHDSTKSLDTTDTPDIALHTLMAAAEEAMEVSSYKRERLEFAGRGLRGQPAPEGLEFRGRLRVPSDRAFAWVERRFREQGYTALLRRDKDEVLLLGVPGTFSAAPSSNRVPLAMFLATVVSVVFVGSLGEYVPGQPINWLAGVPFALAMLGILLAHEMGHFLMARHLGIPTSLPYFIPMPLTLFGTLGAIIRMKAPPRDRRSLLLMASAGPLAGLVVAIPVLLLGLSLSEVTRIPSDGSFIQEGNSLLYVALKAAVFGRVLPSGGEDVFLHPVALAGWAGLLVTAINLIPAGQLDGGHVLYALVGERARQVTMGVIAVFAVLSLLWIGWLVWVGLAFFFARAQAAPLDDLTPVSGGARRVGILLLLIAVLIFVPIPITVT